MPAVFDPTQPFSPVDEALAGTAPANQASPVDAALAAAAPKPVAPVAASAPVFDATQPFTPLSEPAAAPAPPSSTTFDPSANFTKQFTPEDVKNQPVEALDSEKEFNPTDFGHQYEEALNADPALKQKVLEIYRLRERTGRSITDAAEHPLTTAKDLTVGAAKTGVGVVKSLAQGAGQLFVNANNTFNPAVVVPRLLGAASVGGQGAKAGVNAELNRVAQSAAEIAAAPEAAITGTQALLRKSVRDSVETAAALDPTGFVTNVTGVKPVSQLTDKELASRFESDVAGKKSVSEAARGAGYLMQAVGLHADELKTAGIEIRPEVVAKLQTIEDPLNLVLLGEGGAVGAVGKVGGRYTVETIAQAASKEQASALVRGLTNAAKVAGAVTELGGKGVELAGTGIKATVGEITKVVGHGAVTGGIAGSAAGGHFGITKTLLAAKVAGPVIEYTGKGLQTVGRGITAAAPVLGDIASEYVKGYGEGLLITAPFLIGADQQEREGLLGAAALGGIARGGTKALAVGGKIAGTALAVGGKIAGTALQEQLAKPIFKAVEQSKPPEVPAYGTDATLDTSHATLTKNLPVAQQNLMGWARNLFKDSGVEFYAVDDAGMKRQTGGESGRGYAVKTSTAEGKPIVRVFLNGDVESLPHEMLHALGNIDAPGYKDFLKTVNDTVTPEQRKYFEEIYGTVQNGGLPEAKWKFRLTPEELSAEIGAEVFSRVVLGEDLSGVSPTLVKKGTLFTSSLLESMGIPLGDVSQAQAKDFQVKGEKQRAGYSTLGLRPSAKAVTIGQEFVRGLLKQGGVKVPKEKSALGVITPADITNFRPNAITRRPPPGGPAGPAAPTSPGGTPRAPAPASPGATTPAVPPAVNPPSGPRNIRVTRERQGDFASAALEAVADNPEQVEIVKALSEANDLGAPVEIHYKSVTDTGSPADPTERTPRRKKQEEAYQKEKALLNAVEEVLSEKLREETQKVAVVTRLKTTGGKVQVLAISLDKAVANAHNLAKQAAKVGFEIPFATDANGFTPEGWIDYVDGLKKYGNNQAHGYKGDGGKLNRAGPEAQMTDFPVEDASYVTRELDSDPAKAEAKANFINATMGLDIPIITRSPAGKVPGNVKGQILAELNLRPRGIEPPVGRLDIPTFKESGRPIMEMNPLRNDMRAAGIDPTKLIEVTERLNLEHIEKVIPRKELDFGAPQTDIIRGGFLPGGPEFFKQNTVEEIGRAVLDSPTPESWQALTTEMGGLTGAAYRLGHSLKDVADVAKLRQFQSEALAKYNAAKIAMDFDAMMPAATKKQFFAEAIETATGSSPNKHDLIGRSYLAADWKPPFPEEALKGQFLPAAGFTKELDPIKEAAKAAMDFDAAMPAAGKTQFFREALETATGSSPGKKDMIGRIIGADWKPPFPEEATPKGQLLPKSSDPRAVQDSAIRNSETGEIFKDSTHGGAMRKAAMAEGIPKEEFSLSTAYANPNYEQGFVTQGGDFLTRSEAMKRVAEIGQISPENLADASQLGKGEKLESVGFQSSRKFLPGEQTDAALRHGFLPDPKPSKPEPDTALRTLAGKIAVAAGVDYNPAEVYAPLDPKLSNKLADFYDTAKSAPDSPEVVASYKALTDETLKQYRAIAEAGYVIEPFTGEGEPYKSSAEAVADIRDNKHLFVLTTKGENFSGDVNNPMLAPSGVEGLPTENDVFRGVHDFFGHAKEGYQFGPRGEFNAWRAHSEMYSPGAQGALAAETLAQNSWVNFGPHLRGKAEIPPSERPFAEQKAVVVPQELIDEARGVVGQLLPKTEAGKTVDELPPIKKTLAETPEWKAYLTTPEGKAWQKARDEQAKQTPKSTGELLPKTEVGKKLVEGDIKKVPGRTVALGSLEIRGKRGNAITPESQFLPARIKRDDQDRPLTKGGLVDYEKLYKETIAKEKSRNAAPTDYSKYAVTGKSARGPEATGWILPDKTFVPLDVAFHENYLAENSAELNKKFGTKFGKTPDPEDRLAALNAGFVRIRGGLQGERRTSGPGGVVVELNGRYFRKFRPALESYLLDRSDSIDNLTVSLLNDKGGTIDSARATVHELEGEERANAMLATLDDLRLRGPAGDFLPGGEGTLPGLNLPSEERAKQMRVKVRVAKSKDKYPEALKLAYAKDDEHLDDTRH